MATYTLHCFAQSGNAYKAALTLQLAGAIVIAPRMHRGAEPFNMAAVLSALPAPR
jgi:hypothetical protein